MTNLGLRRTSLADALISEIQQMISKGDLQGGQKAPSESELAARFGVGRSTVREAMKALALMGAVDISPGRGTFVRHEARELLVEAKMARLRLRDPRIQEVYEARKVIEVELAALAAERATDEDIREIQAALSLMRHTQQDSEAFAAADLRFHLAVARAGKNSLLEQFYSLADHLVAKVITELIGLPSVKASSLALHTATCDAIARRDPAAARAGTLHHMQYIRRIIETVGCGAPQRGTEPPVSDQ